MFEKDGVRAGPSAPESTEEGGDKEEGEAGAGDEEKENPEVLGEESEPEEVKLALGQIEKDSRGVIDRDPGKSHVDDEKENRENPPRDGKASGDIGRMEDVVRPVLIDRGHAVEVGFLF